MSDVATDVMSVIKKKIRVDRSEITMDDRLADLGLESLDALELFSISKRSSRSRFR